MESFNNNNNKSQENKSLLNSVQNKSIGSMKKSMFPSLSQPKQPDQSQESQKANSIFSNKPISSIMEKMSSIKPKSIQSIKSIESVKENVENVTEKIGQSSTFSFMKIALYIILAILVLSFIGFNIFNYLAEGTDIITTISAPFVNLIAILTGDTAKTTISNTGTGSKTLVDSASGTGKTLLDNVEKGTTGTIDYVQKNIKKTADKAAGKNVVSTANNDSLTEDTKENKNDEPEPTRTNSLNQGYCYIGKINDTRYCAKVSGRSHCMSGDIYPSMDICVNPNLRA